MTSDVYPCLLTGKSEQHGYDCYQRNPLYCRAQDECLWELQALTRHYHPTVSLYAGTILQVRVVDCAAWLLVVLLLEDLFAYVFLKKTVVKSPHRCLVHNVTVSIFQEVSSDDCRVGSLSIRVTPSRTSR